MVAQAYIALGRLRKEDLGFKDNPGHIVRACSKNKMKQNKKVIFRMVPVSSCQNKTLTTASSAAGHCCPLFTGMGPHAPQCQRVLPLHLVAAFLDGSRQRAEHLGGGRSRSSDAQRGLGQWTTASNARLPTACQLPRRADWEEGVV
jgi:hypothetical protein